jgi:hypothetical protein
MSLSAERLAAIRAMGEDEFRTLIESDMAVDNLLAEVDRLRSAFGSMAVLLRSVADRIDGGVTPDPCVLRAAALCAAEFAGGAA